MNVENISVLFNENIDIIKDVKRYKNIINMGNGLRRFDYINRIMIEIQKPDSYDLKTDEEWQLCGRQLMKKAEPVFVIMPKLVYKYIESDTNKEFINSDLNPEETVKALEYNIINKVVHVEDVFTYPVYDVRHTAEKISGNYDTNIPKVNKAKLIEVIMGIMGVDVVLGDKTYWDNAKNTVYIFDKHYEEFVYSLSNILTKFYVINNVKELSVETSDKKSNSISKQDMQLLKNSISYSIETLLLGKSESDLSLVSETTKQQLLNILNIVDRVISEISYQLENTAQFKSESAFDSILRIKRSEALLDILESNSVNRRIHGQ